MKWPLVFCNFSYLLIGVYIGISTLKTRFHNKAINISIFMCLFLIQCLYNINGPTQLTTVMSTVNYVILFSLMFETTLIYSLFSSFFLMMLNTSSEFISMLIMNVLFNLNGLTEYNSILYFIALVFANIIYFLLCTIFVRFKKKYSVVQFPKHSWLILIVPFSTLFITLLIPNYFALVENDKDIVIALLLLAISNMITLFFFFNFIYNINLEMTLKKETEQKMQLEHEISLYSQYYQEHFNLLHTLLHRYTDMKKYLVNQEYDLLDKTLEDLSEKTFNEFNSIYSESYTLNILINQNLETLRKFNINIRTKLKCSNFTFFERIDEINFFKELLRISIDACKIKSNSLIYISSEEKFNQLVIQVRFPSNHNLKELLLNNMILHEIINKYGIIPSYKYDEENGIMILSFICFLSVL